MSRAVRVVPASAADVPALVVALGAALDGSGPAVLPVAVSPSGVPDAGPSTGGTVPDDVALLVRTSGSTGTPREVMLMADALRASADATHRHLSGPGQWLLALPARHVAGLQVLVRSIVAGTEPVVLDGPFRADAFAAAVRRLPPVPPVPPAWSAHSAERAHEVRRAHGSGGPRYTSLVPTQLQRLLADPEGVAALRTFHAVLIGGAAASPALVAEARSQGVRIVTTYGMSETCGGCVYDGVPLDGVSVDLEDDGRITIAGPVLAAGYRDRPDLDAELFAIRDGRRVLRTSDLGCWADPGDGAPPRLAVLGRVDDVLVTGGVKVAPAAVERVLAESVPGVQEALVVGVPDPEWGQALVAVVVLTPGASAPDLADLRRAVTDRLGAAAAPRHLVTVVALPLRGPGKPDRRGAAVLAARALGRDDPTGTGVTPADGPATR